jgi:hypothetical protein
MGDYTVQSTNNDSFKDYSSLPESEKTNSDTKIYTQIQESNETQVQSVEVPFTSWNEKNSSELGVVWRILQLLKDMVDILQQAAVEESKELKYEVEFQGTYSTMATEVPVFLQTSKDKNEKGGIGGTSSDQAKTRYDLNSVYNANLQDRLRSYKDFHGDNAKEIQNDMDQAKSNANKQMDTMRSFLDQMKNLSGLILR